MLGGVGYVATLARVAAFEAAMAVAPAMPLRLAALGCRVEEDVERLAARLRLSNAERDRMLAALAAARALTPRPDGRGGRGALYRLTRRRSVTGLRWLSLLPRPRPTKRPGPTLSASGPLESPGVSAGRARPDRRRYRARTSAGRLLHAIETWWIEHDFTPDLAALRARLQQMIAAEQ